MVDYDGTELYINAGTSSGMKSGDKLVIERIAKTLTDPSTGEVLKIQKQKIGLLTLKSVEDRISSGAFQALDLTKPQRGDLVSLE
ncbi:hypothetical protein [Dongia sp.]|uniref:hypothetical protein n=1 Tax=Dongia sp. TaxID=1977262 RepID=UPI0034A16330